jgi:hypothetical protein
MQQGAVPV